MLWNFALSAGVSGGNPGAGDLGEDMVDMPVLCWVIALTPSMTGKGPAGK